MFIEGINLFALIQHDTFPNQHPDLLHIFFPLSLGQVQILYLVLGHHDDCRHLSSQWHGGAGAANTSKPVHHTSSSSLAPVFASGKCKQNHQEANRNRNLERILAQTKLNPNAYLVQGSSIFREVFSPIHNAILNSPLVRHCEVK